VKAKHAYYGKLYGGGNYVFLHVRSTLYIYRNANSVQISGLDHRSSSRETNATHFKGSTTGLT